MTVKDLYEKTRSGKLLSESEYLNLVTQPLEELTYYAGLLKEENLGKEIETCAIINARSGLCSEDCSFCAQSSHYSTGAPVYEFIDLKKIESASEKLAEKGVQRFSVVTSGITPNEKEFELIVESVKIIKSKGLIPDVSVGILSEERLLKLKEAGLSGVHHNLETSRSFFPNICTTHSYEDDVNAVRDALSLGFYVCSGGIFGLGESWEQRVELAFTLKELNVQSVPINFLTPINGTPLEGRKSLSYEEAMKIIAVYRFILPDRQIRICGGRSVVFNREERKDILTSGAGAIMVGDYLTLKGASLDEDMSDLKNHFGKD